MSNSIKINEMDDDKEEPMTDITQEDETISDELKNSLRSDEPGSDNFTSFDNSLRAVSSEEKTALSWDDFIPHIDGERMKDIFYQTFLPFLIAGLGSIGAGQLLHYSQNLDLLIIYPQIISLCPPLQGLKGNLDMTFTSRLTTMSHQGKLSKGTNRMERILRNMALIQAQAIVLSLFACVLCYCLSAIGHSSFASFSSFTFLASASILSTTLSCAIMSVALVSLVIGSRAHGINPDNVATPLAASIGDLLSIGGLLLFCYMLLPFHNLSKYNSIVLIGSNICLLPLWFFLSARDEGALAAAKLQWPSLLIASILSGFAGFIQEWAVDKYPEITAYQPLIAGIAGNRAALQSSRISSSFHMNRSTLASYSLRLNPYKYYSFQNQESGTARLLLFTSLPYQIIFVMLSIALSLTMENPLKFSLVFIMGYLLIVFIQVFILLFLAQLVVFLLWRFELDPDLHAIPFLTSVADLLGTSLLALLYLFLHDVYPQSIRVAESDSNSTMTS